MEVYGGRSLELLFVLGSSVKGWLVLFTLAAGPTVMVFGLYVASMQYLSAGIANLIVTSEPVFTAIAALHLFGALFPCVLFIPPTKDFAISPKFLLITAQSRITIPRRIRPLRQIIIEPPVFTASVIVVNFNIWRNALGSQQKSWSPVWNAVL